MKEFIKSKKKIIVVLIIIAVLIAGKLVFDKVIASDFMISRTIEQRNERKQKEMSINKIL